MGTGQSWSGTCDLALGGEIPSNSGAAVLLRMDELEVQRLIIDRQLHV